MLRNLNSRIWTVMPGLILTAGTAWGESDAWDSIPKEAPAVEISIEDIPSVSELKTVQKPADSHPVAEAILPGDNAPAENAPADGAAPVEESAPIEEAAPAEDSITGKTAEPAEEQAADTIPQITEAPARTEETAEPAQNAENGDAAEAAVPAAEPAPEAGTESNGSEAMTEEILPEENAPAENIPAENASAENIPVEIAPVETAADQSVPADADSIEAMLTEAKPEETAPVKAIPAEAAQAENAPAENTQTETAPAESAPSETAQADSAAEAVQPNVKPVTASAAPKTQTNLESRLSGWRVKAEIIEKIRAEAARQSGQEVTVRVAKPADNTVLKDDPLLSGRPSAQMSRKSMLSGDPSSLAESVQNPKAASEPAADDNFMPVEPMDEFAPLSDTVPAADTAPAADPVPKAEAASAAKSARSADRSAERSTDRPAERSPRERGSAGLFADRQSEIFAVPKEVEVGPGDVKATDAFTKLPVGAGFDATVSANTQGKLIELGIEAKNEDGTTKLDENGHPVIIPLRRGMTVKAGDVLGKQFNQEYLARKDAAERRLIVAEKESKKVLEIDVAELASLVAKSELDRAYQANRDMPGSVAEQEVVKLAYEYNRSYKAWEKAKYDLDIKADELEVSKAEISIADAQLEERKLISPIDGQIDDIYQNEGEWLREGDDVFRVIRLDKISIEARFDSTVTSPDRIQGKKATVYASRPGEPVQQFEGIVTYARPIIEHNRFLAYVEVQNTKTESGSWYFIPGFHVYVVVHP